MLGFLQVKSAKFIFKTLQQKCYALVVIFSILTSNESNSSSKISHSSFRSKSSSIGSFFKQASTLSKKLSFVLALGDTKEGVLGDLEGVVSLRF